MTASSDDVFSDRYVLVPRRWTPDRKGSRSHRYQKAWTEHVTTCSFLARDGVAAAARPSPKQPYANTVACQYCKPRSGHESTRVDYPDGRCQLTCECGIKVEGRTWNAARGTFKRRHDRAEAQAAKQTGDGT